MRRKNYFLVSVLLVGGLIFSAAPLIHAQTSPVTSQTESKSQLIARLLIQLHNLQTQLANMIKYQPGKPLNTITEITGPKSVRAGEYNAWTFVTNNSDPDNASSLMIDWGDGMTSASGVGHTYSTPGTYTIVATNHDGNGEPATAAFIVSVTADKSTGTLTAWGNKLVTSKSLIPANKFRAYFFNTKNFNTVVAPAIVDQPLFAYPSDSLAVGMDNQFEEHTLAAYWVGSFTYTQDTTLYFDFSNPQWDVARFIVDGKTIIETNRLSNNTETTHINLNKGNHVIEVEYQVNWHAGFFRAKVGTTNPTYTDITTARAQARIIAGSSAVTVPVDEYASANPLTGITVVSIPSTATPKILDLSSYEATVWDVRGASARGVKAIILSSYSGAADVINADNIPILRTRNYTE